MADTQLHRINVHRANLDRYARLLATNLSEPEKEYVRRRMEEEQAALVKAETMHL